MKDTMFSPCPEWADKLAAYHSHNLSPSDRDAITNHLASCEACTAVLWQYREMDEHIHRMLSANPLPDFSPQLLPTREETIWMKLSHLLSFLRQHLWPSTSHQSYSILSTLQVRFGRVTEGTSPQK